jgi:hypothetical protein
LSSDSSIIIAIQIDIIGIGKFEQYRAGCFKIIYCKIFSQFFQFKQRKAIMTLLNQQLEAAVTAASIARAAEYKAAAATKLRVTFASAFHAGSANVNAHVG